MLGIYRNDVMACPLGIEMKCFFAIISNSSHLKKSLIAFGIFRIPASLALQFLHLRGGFRNSNRGTVFGEFANSPDMNSVKETDLLCLSQWVKWLPKCMSTITCKSEDCWFCYKHMYNKCANWCHCILQFCIFISINWLDDFRFLAVHSQFPIWTFIQLFQLCFILVTILNEFFFDRLKS